MQDIDNFGNNPQSKTYNLYEPHYKQAGKIFGVTVHSAYDLRDPDSLAAEFNSQYTNKSLPISRFIKDGRKFLGFYGTSLEVATEDNIANTGVDKKDELLNKADLGGQGSKAAILDAASTLSMYPEEYIKSIKLKKVVLKNGSTTPAYASDGVIYMNVNNFKKDTISGVFHHELWHVIDAAQCMGNTERDPQYTAKNNGVAYDDKFKIITESLLKPVSYKELYKTFIKEKSSIFKGLYSQENSEQRCNSYSLLEDKFKYIKTATPYSYSSVVEDKADLGKSIIGTSNYIVELIDMMPAIKYKAAVLIARMKRQDPKSAAFISSQSSNPLFLRGCE